MNNEERNRHIFRGTVGTYGDIIRLQIPLVPESMISVLWTDSREDLVRYYSTDYFRYTVRYARMGYALDLTFSGDGFRSFESILGKPDDEYG